MEVTKQVVFRLDFFIDFVCFFKVFSMIFKSKNAVKLPKTILAKTSKIVLPSRRNAEFQEIEVTKNKNYKAQIDEKSYIFGDIDSMCCAQTAAPEGKECKAPVNEKRGYGMNKRIWFQSARRSKTHAKIYSRSLPKPSPASPQTLQNRGSGNPWE